MSTANPKHAVQKSTKSEILYNEYPTCQDVVQLKVVERVV